MASDGEKIQVYRSVACGGFAPLRCRCSQTDFAREDLGKRARSSAAQKRSPLPLLLPHHRQFLTTRTNQTQWHPPENSSRARSTSATTCELVQRVRRASSTDRSPCTGSRGAFTGASAAGDLAGSFRRRDADAVLPGGCRLVQLGVKVRCGPPLAPAPLSSADLCNSISRCSESPVTSTSPSSTSSRTTRCATLPRSVYANRQLTVWCSTNAQEIEWVGCCNELNASYAADGYARVKQVRRRRRPRGSERRELTEIARPTVPAQRVRQHPGPQDPGRSSRPRGPSHDLRSRRAQRRQRYR